MRYTPMSDNDLPCNRLRRYGRVQDQKACMGALGVHSYRILKGGWFKGGGYKGALGKLREP